MVTSVYLSFKLQFYIYSYFWVIYRNECKAQIDDFKFPTYKKFPTLEEAEQFIKDNQGASKFGNTSKGGPSTSKSLLGHIPVPAAPAVSIRSLTTVAYGHHNFHKDGDGYVHCYTDGACESNGKVKAKAGIGVWFGLDHPLWVDYLNTLRMQ